MISAVPLVAAIGSLGAMYVLGARMFSGTRWGIASAVFFGLTPLLWREIQTAPASLYPLSFVVGWLVAVAYWQGTLESAWAAIAGGVLGAGIYTSRAAVVMMPVYLLLTIVVLLYAGRVTVRHLAWLLGAFVVAAGPFTLSLLLHPDDFRETVNAYHLYDTTRFTVWQGLREMGSWVGLTARSEVYFDFFNPAFLFTGRVLFWPLAVLVPAGLWRIVTHEPTPLALLSLGGFFAAPCAAALTAQAPNPRRIVFLTPFAAIVAVYGVQQVLSWPTWLFARQTRFNQVPRVEL